jgi:NADPH-dependent 2,4-dienoyl-CoA reductase/sulfur reductase-like enzyme
MTFAIDTDIAVVGAGPAGLSAALAASNAGAHVVVLDEYPEPGGQFYKQLPTQYRVPDRTQLDDDYTKGDKLLGAVRAAGITLSTETLVWGSFEPGVLCVLRRREAGTVKARKIIVASGAYERTVPFPGWDLPGVMTPGGAQTLVKNQQLMPGNHILLAGSGPFLLPVAKSLISAGAKLAGIYEATRPLEWVSHSLRLWGHWDRIGEGLRYRRAIAEAGIPIRFGWIVVRAEGSEMLERVVLMKCDKNGQTIAGTDHIECVDTLCVGYGFIPSVQLTRLLGCEHVFDGRRGGWIPKHNRAMETSMPGVFVAGEVAGIGGVYAALAEGALAGLSAAGQLGYKVRDAELSKAQSERRICRSFGDLVNDVFAVKPAVFDQITDDTLVCRCEEVTAGQIRTAAVSWGANVNFIKGVTRCGMGYCQGRICGSIVETLTAKTLGLPPGMVDYFHARPPVKPVRVQELAEFAEE